MLAASACSKYGRFFSSPVFTRWLAVLGTCVEFSCLRLNLRYQLLALATLQADHHIMVGPITSSNLSRLHLVNLCKALQSLAKATHTDLNGRYSEVCLPVGEENFITPTLQTVLWIPRWIRIAFSIEVAALAF